MAKDSSKFIEKPCEIGDTVYYIERCRTAEDFGEKYIDFAKVKNILVNSFGNWLQLSNDLLINFDNIGKIAFFSYEEAKQSLKSMDMGNMND